MTAIQPVTYAIGDIHGEVTLLQQLLSILPLQEEDTLVFLGDYVDRGEDSLATINVLRDLRRKHPSCVFLRGNHEDAWLAEWDGMHFTGPSAIEGAMKFWDDCEGHVPSAVGFFMEETRITYEDQYAYYVHAGLMPDRSMERTSDFTKMWGVPTFLGSTYDWGKPVVFGHWRLQAPLLQPNKIGIDTGAYHGGALTAVRLPDRRIFQARREDTTDISIRIKKDGE